MRVPPRTRTRAASRIKTFGSNRCSTTARQETQSKVASRNGRCGLSRSIRTTEWPIRSAKRLSRPTSRRGPASSTLGAGRDVGRDNRFADRCCCFRPRALANLPPPNFLVEHAGGASDRPSSHLISRRRDGLKSLFPRLVGVRPEGVRVSVVVTVKNDPRVIDCAERVLSQDASFPFELVIVDNGSTNDTPRLLRDR